MTKAVIEQTTMVSTKTSKTPTRPCSDGWFTLAMPCAIGALPRPASFDSTPRLTPAATICAKPAPAKPPTAADGVNALETICAMTAGMAVRLMSR